MADFMDSDNAFVCIMISTTNLLNFYSDLTKFYTKRKLSAGNLHIMFHMHSFLK